MDVGTVVEITVTAVTAVITLRIVILLYTIYMTECTLINNRPAFRTILCIGSGGHTTELLRLSKSLNIDKYQPRLYILAKNDSSSEVKIHEAEHGQNNYTISKIPRSRNVHQSFKSSIVTTVYSIITSLPIIYRFQPDIILCNGPGTCVPICFVAFILRCLFLCDCRIVFIESICRVRSLSLSGYILQYIADVFVVQWPQLRDVCYRAKYFGRLT